MTTRPSPDEVFEATAPTHRYNVELRRADGVAEVLADFAEPIARAVGVIDLQVVGSVQVDGGDPVDLALVNVGLDLRTTVAQYRRGDLSVFLVSGRHLSGIDEVGCHERLLAQRSGVSVCEIVVRTSLSRRIAGKGLELDQAHVRVTHGLDSVLGGVVGELVDALRVPRSVVVPPDADLDGVRLGGGRASGGGTGRATVEWTLHPTAVDAVRDRFDEYIRRCFERFELGAVPKLETTSTRSSNAVPTSKTEDTPDGPFSLLTRSTATTADRRVRLVLSTVEAYWSEGEIDRVSVNLDMRTATDRLRIVATGRAGAACTQLRLHRPTSGAAIEALWETFDALLDEPR